MAALTRYLRRHMATGTLDLGPLRRSLSALRKVTRMDLDDDVVRDAAVKRFEFTYEQAHKLLRRYIESASADPAAVDAMTFPDLIRTANEQGLLSGDWPRWRAFREMRARTSHTYHEDTARAVVSMIPDFVAEARFLRDELKRRLR